MPDATGQHTTVPAPGPHQQTICDILDPPGHHRCHHDEHTTQAAQMTRDPARAHTSGDPCH